MRSSIILRFRKIKNGGLEKSAVGHQFFCALKKLRTTDLKEDAQLDAQWDRHQVLVSSILIK